MYNSYALNSFLTFRFVYGDEKWKRGLTPYAPSINDLERYEVNSSDDIIKSISQVISNIDLSKSALLLSGGIDSAIIASLLKKNTPAYTIRFIADNAVDESQIASIYASEYKLNHKIINIDFKTYMSALDILIENKKSPLHPVEPALYIAAELIKKDGFTNILTGCNADGKFGGLDGLLSKDWKLNEFIERYSFVDSKFIVKEYYDMSFVYEKYFKKNYFDTQSFIKDIFGYDTYLAFLNGINSAGCKLIAPFAYLKLNKKLDIQKIRHGQSKYLLREVFEKKYKNFNEIPHKIAFARPMDQWLRDWDGPKRNEFKSDINISSFSGNQKWLIYCLEYFLNYFDEKNNIRYVKD